MPGGWRERDGRFIVWQTQAVVGEGGLGTVQDGLSQTISGVVKNQKVL